MANENVGGRRYAPGCLTESSQTTDDDSRIHVRFGRLFLLPRWINNVICSGGGGDGEDEDDDEDDDDEAGVASFRRCSIFTCRGVGKVPITYRNQPETNGTSNKLLKFATNYVRPHKN